MIFSTSDFAAVAAPMNHTSRIIVSVLTFLLLLTVGTGAGYVAFLNHAVTTEVKAHSTDAGPDGSTSAPAKDPAAKNALSILLVGSDSRGSVAKGRCD